MIQLLPFEILDWIDPGEINLDSYHNDDPTDCFLEVDIDYSYELYDLHNDYLLATKKK